ncbi:MAG: hypothetical protein WB780_20415 [Candidatus Acidiferrales bacterium]
MKMKNELLCYMGSGGYYGTCVPADDRQTGLFLLRELLRDVGDTETDAAAWLDANGIDDYWLRIRPSETGQFVGDRYDTADGKHRHHVVTLTCDDVAILSETYAESEEELEQLRRAADYSD